MDCIQGVKGASLIISLIQGVIQFKFIVFRRGCMLISGNSQNYDVPKGWVKERLASRYHSQISTHV